MNYCELATDLLEPCAVMLHGWRDVATRAGGDADVVVPKASFGNFVGRLARDPRWRIVQMLQHEATCFCFVPAGRRRPVLARAIDVELDYRRDGRIWLSNEELLEGACTRNGLRVAAPHVEFDYVLLKKILKQHAPEHSLGRLEELARELGAEAEQIAVHRLGRHGIGLVRLLREGRWRPDRAELARLRRVLRLRRLLEDPTNAVRYHAADLPRRVRRWLQPTGLAVGILGPDGSGKTTLATRLLEDLAPSFPRTALVHFLPRVLRPVRGGGPVTDPHALPARGATASLFKLAYYACEAVAGWYVRVRPQLVRSTLVVFDRYLHDVLVDPVRYRYGGPAWLARWVGRLMPKPDIFILLDLPAELACARKPEVAPQEARRLRERYLALARELGAHVVDASRPLEEVVGEVEEIILTHLERRTRERLRRLFPEAFAEDR